MILPFFLSIPQYINYRCRETVCKVFIPHCHKTQDHWSRGNVGSKDWDVPWTETGQLCVQSSTAPAKGKHG